MQRRHFVRNLAWLTGGLFINYTPAGALIPKGKKIKGKVLSDGKGLQDVVISDGYNVLMTDKKGKYEFMPHPDALAVFLSTPSGYAFKNQDGIAKHYRLFQEVNTGKDINFDLAPLGVNDDEHDFIIWADPQVKNAKDVEKMMSQSVPDVQKLVAAGAPGSLIHGITVGDLVWDELKLFGEYNKAVKQMNIPFFQCLGNHDMDYNKGGDETSDDSFQQMYGPTYYSFNRGRVHYVVMDNVRYLGKDRDYDGFLQTHQLEWLKKDLSFVPENRLLVLCMHIPVHKGTKNKDDLYAILGSRKVHIMSGHTHYHVNAINGNIYEHNHGTVCGAWWTGPICCDGTPGGYGVYKVKGTDLSWHYQATGKEAGYQMKIFVKDYTQDQKQVIVNIWNHDPEWETEYHIDGIKSGALEQFEGFDPLAYETMMGPDLPKPRGFAEPRMTDHLFRAIVPSSAREVTIVATDRFGTQYSVVHSMTV